MQKKHFFQQQQQQRAELPLLRLARRPEPSEGHQSACLAAVRTSISLLREKEKERGRQMRRRRRKVGISGISVRHAVGTLSLRMVCCCRRRRRWTRHVLPGRSVTSGRGVIEEKGCQYTNTCVARVGTLPSVPLTQTFMQEGRERMDLSDADRNSCCCCRRRRAVAKIVTVVTFPVHERSLPEGVLTHVSCSLLPSFKTRNARYKRELWLHSDVVQSCVLVLCRL